jgi:enoyl-CoA hydratase
MNYEFLNIETLKDGITIIKFNREKALNALNRAFLKEIRRALGEVDKQSDSRVLILTSSVDKAFIAGADVKEMSALDAEGAESFIHLGNKVMSLIEFMSIPVIAAVNGYALGGGMELALACDMIYASDRAVFGLPEVQLGIMPGFGGSQRLPRRVGRNHARELIFTGKRIDASRAQDMGMVNEVVPHEKLMEHVMKVAKEITKVGGLAISVAKKAVYDGFHHSLDEGAQIETRAFLSLFGTADQKEGMKAFLEKREPNFSKNRVVSQMI